MDWTIAGSIAAVIGVVLLMVGALHSNHDLKSDVKGVRTDVAAVRSDLTAEIGSVRTDLTKEIGAVRSDLTEEIVAVRSEMGDGFDRLAEQIESLRAPAQPVPEAATVLEPAALLMPTEPTDDADETEP